MKEDKYDFIMKWKGATGGCGGGGQEATKVIYAEELGAEIYRVCIIPDWQIEQIADAVVRKLGGMVSGCVYWDSESRFCSLYRPTAEPRSCDRNICASNEVNGISCDECEIAKYNNLEDDDSPCQNCEVGE